MTNNFCSTLEALFVLQILTFFCHYFLVMQSKRLNKNGKVNCKIYDVTIWLTNDYNTHVAPCLTK